MAIILIPLPKSIYSTLGLNSDLNAPGPLPIIFLTTCKLKWPASGPITCYPWLSLFNTLTIIRSKLEIPDMVLSCVPGSPERVVWVYTYLGPLNCCLIGIVDYGLYVSSRNFNLLRSIKGHFLRMSDKGWMFSFMSQLITFQNIYRYISLRWHQVLPIFCPQLSYFMINFYFCLFCVSVECNSCLATWNCQDVTFVL